MQNRKLFALLIAVQSMKVEYSPFTWLILAALALAASSLWYSSWTARVLGGVSAGGAGRGAKGGAASLTAVMSSFSTDSFSCARRPLRDLLTLKGEGTVKCEDGAEGWVQGKGRGPGVKGWWRAGCKSEAFKVGKY